MRVRLDFQFPNSAAASLKFEGYAQVWRTRYRRQRRLELGQHSAAVFVDNVVQLKLEQLLLLKQKVQLDLVFKSWVYVVLDRLSAPDELPLAIQKLKNFHHRVDNSVVDYELERLEAQFKFQG